MSNGTRKKVTRITVEFDDGSRRVYPDDVGYMPVALFWDGDDPANDSGIKILGAYYDGLAASGNPHEMTYDRLERNFCRPIADAVCKPGASVELTTSVIDKIWRTACNPLLGIISKQPGCDAGG
jgi:hypothetical protein